MYASRMDDYALCVCLGACGFDGLKRLFKSENLAKSQIFNLFSPDYFAFCYI